MWPVTGTSYNAQEKVWSGPRLKDLYNTELTIGEAALKQMQRTPQKIIQIVDTTGETFTAKQFSDYSLLLARNLLKFGIKFKDNVGLYAQNSAHVATVMLASFLCGTPVNALFPGFDKDTVVSLYKDTRPKLIYCDVENYPKAQEANEELQLNAKIIVMNGCIEGVSSIKALLKAGEKQQSLDSFEFPCANMTSSDTAAILCSSGTTGTPKGVMCSHHALLHYNVYHSATNDSVFLCFSTMYWASGLLNLVAALLNSNLRIVTDKPYTPEYFLYLVKRYNITHTLVSGTQMAELVLNCSKDEIRKSLRSMDTLLCGGAKIPQPVQEKLVDILSDNTLRPGFSIVYGMSEIAGGLTYNAGYPFEFGPQTEGKLVANKKVRIVDKTGQNLGPNESGEIVIYSPYAWSGYYRNPEATAKALTGQWLHSGDIGFFDEVGFLHVSGRDKDMFKTKNFQICPQPIEDAIMRVPGVAEVCVFPVPDFVAENLVACAIVRTKGSEGVNLTAAMVHEFVQQNVDSMYHLKGGVYIVDVIPKTGSGKVQRQKVAAMFNTKN